MKHLLVIGPGYLGRRVAAGALRRGEVVSVTTRSRDRAAALAADGFRPVVLDVVRPTEGDPLPQADDVLWCVGFDRAAKLPMRDVYVSGLQRTLAVLPRPTGRLVYVSSTGVYGQTGGVWVDEESPAEPTTESGRISVEAEAVLREAVPDAVILRFAGIYGPGRWPGAAAVRAGQAVPGTPDRTLNLIHVEDGAAAVAAAFERARPGSTWCVADDRPLPRGEYYAALTARLNAPAPVFSGTGDDRSDKRVRNARLRGELGVRLRYPDVFTALAGPDAPA
jgi:nucleoside-diphosphate-sugar epimerase